MSVSAVTYLTFSSKNDRCPDECRCKRNRIDCSNSNFYNSTNLRSTNLTYVPRDIIKFRNLRRLNLENNSIGTLTSEQFFFLRFVSDVNLKKNVLIQLPELSSLRAKKSRLKTLDLSENKLETLKAGSFIVFSSMTNLNLSFNRLISINKDAFIGLESLRNLYLNNNLLVSIRSLTFRPLGSLINLDMSNSLISVFADGAFLNATNLRSLSLAHNRISQIGGWLFGLSSLTVIFNNIKYLEKNETSMWSLVTSLQSVYLSHNYISHVSNAFGVLKHLQYLFLNNNNIRSIVDGAFSGIDDQKFDILTVVLFMLMYHLPTFHYVICNNIYFHFSDLSENFLNEYFENGEAFKESNLTLKELVIGCNDISTVPANMFGYVSGLNLLDISGNPISVIEERAFDNLNLERLTLTTSSLICDCNSLWLYNWFNLSNIPQTMIDIKCGYPKKFNGTNFFDLQSSLLICDNDDLFLQPQLLNHSSLLTKSLVLKMLKISCFITGAAPIDVKWSVYSYGKWMLVTKTIRNQYEELEETRNNISMGYICSELIFSSINFVDEGLYRCSARNSYGVVYSPKKPNLYMEGILRTILPLSIKVIVGEEPFLTILPENLTVHVGSVAVLKCAAKGIQDLKYDYENYSKGRNKLSYEDGKPLPVIKWQKEKGWIQAAEEKRLYIKTDEPSLYITETRRSDEGMYKCIAENSFGYAQASAQLSVYGSFKQNRLRKIYIV
uniref:Ig-like domain-containing protein n=1 Tax=Syphacia muris TaxID=451379 RepID=A0A0N5AII6_9BILA